MAKYKFKAGDVVIIKSSKQVVYLKEFWQGVIEGYWLTSKGYYLSDTNFEPACDALRILFGREMSENIKIK